MARLDLDQPLRSAALAEGELWTVTPGQPAQAVARILAEHPVHHVPVIDAEGRLVGLVSASDMLRAGYDWSGGRHVEPDPKLRVEHVMQPRPVTVHAGATLRDAAELLAGGQFHAVPVVDAGERLVGLVTSTDLIQRLVEAPE